MASLVYRGPESDVRGRWYGDRDQWHDRIEVAGVRVLRRDAARYSALVRFPARPGATVLPSGRPDESQCNARLQCKKNASNGLQDGLRRNAPHIECKHKV